MGVDANGFDDGQPLMLETGTGASATVQITDGPVFYVSLCGLPMYWVNGAWSPYPPSDKITIVDKSSC